MFFSDEFFNLTIAQSTILSCICMNSVVNETTMSPLPPPPPPLKVYITSVLFINVKLVIWYLLIGLLFGQVKSVLSCSLEKQEYDFYDSIHLYICVPFTVFVTIVCLA